MVQRCGRWGKLPLMEGHLGYFQLGAITNKAAMKIYIRGVCVCVCVCVCNTCFHFSKLNAQECHCWVIGWLQVSFYTELPNRFSRITVPFYIPVGGQAA